MHTAKLIEKEQIPSLKFSSFEVLNTPEEKLERRANIEKAMLIGNSSKSKSKIFFMTEEGLMEVETTVWAATDDSVTLKGGVIIPLHCITKTELI
ncbi:MAG: hypothetical protein MUC81_07100 [Bacteroidia bacterium]|jgi:hypothetical protein|nr:hypothetical protein [Bacteroidia bacterium]